MNLTLNVIAAPVLFVLSVLQIRWEYQLKYVFKDGRTKANRRLRKGLLYLTLVLFFVNQFVAGQKAENLNSQINTLNSNQTNLVQKFDNERQSLNAQITNLTSQSSVINSNQLNLSQQYQLLLSELATNSSIDLNMRQHIVDATKQFEVVDSQVFDWNAWQAALGHQRELLKIQRDRTLEEQQTYYTQCKPMFDYAIRTLKDMSGKVAAIKRDAALSDYKGLPSVINVSLASELVAEIKFQTNSTWSFQVILNEPGLKHLRIVCKNGY
jgi:hypothetical protein